MERVADFSIIRFRPLDLVFVGSAPHHEFDDQGLDDSTLT